jgi:hypothetical protein
MLLTSDASAQAIARSFEDLAKVVRAGQTVLVTNQRGQEVTARIADITSSSLTVVTKETTRDPAGVQRQTWTAKHVFSDIDVQRIRRSSGATGKGALIGAGTAFLISLFVAANYSGGEGFCGACLGAGLLGGVPLGAGIGAGVGFGISRARRPIIYLAPDRMASPEARPPVRF